MRGAVAILALLVAVVALALPPGFQGVLAALQASPPTTDGLISYWDMEASGATVPDQQGGNDGTAVNTPTFNASYGVRGKGVRLVAASSQHIDMGYTSNLNNQSFTLSCWVKRASTGSQRCLSVNMDAGAPRSGTTVGTGGGNTLIIYDSVTSSYVVDTGETFTSTADWYHFVWTKDGTTLKMYADNVEVYSGTISATLPYSANGTTGIGAIYTTGAAGSFWDGWVDEVRVWDRALTPAEITTTYNWDKAGAGH